jgi:hypothetical protein
VGEEMCESEEEKGQRERKEGRERRRGRDRDVFPFKENSNVFPGYSIIYILDILSVGFVDFRDGQSHSKEKRKEKREERREKRLRKERRRDMDFFAG